MNTDEKIEDLNPISMEDMTKLFEQYMILDCEQASYELQNF